MPFTEFPDGGGTVDTGPPYQMIQVLPANGELYALTLMMSERILDDPQSVIETRRKFDQIPCDNEVLPPEFRRTIPETTFSSFDISVPLFSTLATEGVELKFIDAINPRRKLTIKQPEDTGTSDVLSIHDTHDLRQPASLKWITKKAVYAFLSTQVDARVSVDDAPQGMISRMAMILGKRAQGQSHEIVTGRTELSGGVVLHTEKDDRTNRYKNSIQADGEIFSTWTTNQLADGLFNTIEGVKIRTIARQDGTATAKNNAWLTREVDADTVPEFESVAFMRATMLATTTERMQESRVFRQRLLEYYSISGR